MTNPTRTRLALGRAALGRSRLIASVFERVGWVDGRLSPQP